MIVGVVGHTGLILNDFFSNPGFEVERRGFVGYDVRLLEFENPIVIACPQWYTNGGTEYPLDIAHLGLAVERSGGRSGYEFSVQAGTYVEGFNGKESGRNLGMNFIALDPSLDNDNIKFGFVDVNEDGLVIGQPTTNKYSAGAIGLNDNVFYFQTELCEKFRNDRVCPTVEVSGREGGILVYFTYPFTALPSVIVTPVIEDSGSNRACSASERGFSFKPDDFFVPHCVVETIRKDSIFVKCACVSSTSLNENNPTMRYDLLPFNFIAVGPVAE
jgi:hypothetical protein